MPVPNKFSCSQNVENVWQFNQTGLKELQNKCLLTKYVAFVINNVILNWEDKQVPILGDRNRIFKNDLYFLI